MKYPSLEPLKKGIILLVCVDSKFCYLAYVFDNIIRKIINHQMQTWFTNICYRYNLLLRKYKILLIGMLDATMSYKSRQQLKKHLHTVHMQKTKIPETSKKFFYSVSSSTGYL